MKRKFTAREVEDLFFEGEIEEGESSRWHRGDTSIVEVDGKYYSLYANIGLTENQYNEWEDQEADEVELVEKTVVIKEWVPVSSENLRVNTTIVDDSKIQVAKI